MNVKEELLHHLLGGGGDSVDKMLKFTLKFQCDGQGAVRRAILYMDRSCLYNIILTL